MTEKTILSERLKPKHKTMTEELKKYEELMKAKENVKWLLDNPDGLVDMHGLEYWAGVVERLRQEVKI